MKTTTSLTQFTISLRTLIIGIALSAFSLNSFAQTPYLSLIVARDVTGSGLGGNVCPSLSLTFNKNTISVGPNFQRRKLNFSGFQANYRYAMASTYNKKFDLYFSGNITLHQAAYMSRTNIEIEKSCNEEGARNYEELQFQVIEGYAGLGLKYNPTKNLSAGFGAGLGMFDTLNDDYNKEMYREKSSVALQLRFILAYSFKTW
ncbi:MAG TPA: hypothetical protein VGC65_09835 [Bacteroidia bacterium]